MKNVHQLYKVTSSVQSTHKFTENDSLAFSSNVGGKDKEDEDASTRRNPLVQQNHDGIATLRLGLPSSCEVF